MKIGIITHYYKSLNYGGNLQAYALVEKIKEINPDVEQISYIFNDDNLKIKRSFIQRIKKHSFIQIIKKMLVLPSILLRKYYYKQMQFKFNDQMEKRKKALLNFNFNKISHSFKVYNNDDINNSVKDYDIFITGSDQVWNLNWYYPAFFLNFVASGKKKIAYSASISMDKLTDEQKLLFKNHLADFNAVSVREKSDVFLLSDLTDLKVKFVLDPTLLLSKEDWDKICYDRIIQDKYLFCYFLGQNINERKLAKDYAKKHKLKIVTLPYLCDFWHQDRRFGDYKLYDISPEKFLSLIKYSEIVFTDSFHAIVFSHIYQKQYFIFNRTKRKEMSSRIYSITTLLKTSERYCDTKEKENILYLESRNLIDYGQILNEFEVIKKESLNFLFDNLKEKE